MGDAFLTVGVRKFADPYSRESNRLSNFFSGFLIFFSNIFSDSYIAIGENKSTAKQ